MLHTMLLLHRGSGLCQMEVVLDHYQGPSRIAKQEGGERNLRMRRLVRETTFTRCSCRFTQDLLELQKILSGPSEKDGPHVCHNWRRHRDLFQVSQGTGGCMCKPLSGACSSMVLGAPSQRSVSIGRGSCCEDERCCRSTASVGCTAQERTACLVRGTAWEYLRVLSVLMLSMLLQRIRPRLSSFEPLVKTGRLSLGTEPGEDIMNYSCCARFFEIGPRSRLVAWISPSLKDPQVLLADVTAPTSSKFCIPEIGTGT